MKDPINLMLSARNKYILVACNRSYPNLESILTDNDKNLIYREDIQQLYCENCKKFLPDRYVEGLCPACGRAEDLEDLDNEDMKENDMDTKLICPNCGTEMKLPEKSNVVSISFSFESLNP